MRPYPWNSIIQDTEMFEVSTDDRTLQPEGMTMRMETLLEHNGRQKAENVRAERYKHLDARIKLLGAEVQPIPGFDG
jgi:hypothetical protein